MVDLNAVKQLLLSENFTCVLFDGKEIITSRERGVKPLIDFILSEKDFCGFVAADKIVGKAVALLYANLKISALYAQVATYEAVEICKKYNIKIVYDILTDKIINRKGDDICPMEKLVADVDIPEIAKQLIIQKLKTL